MFHTISYIASIIEILISEWQLCNIDDYRDDRHPYFKPGKPKDDEQEEDLNDANYDEVAIM